jgi:CheY-like chemotaxis protein
MSDGATARILCVDDEPRVLDGMKRTLGMDFDVITAEGGAQALALLIRKERFALTISDMRMPGMDGAAYLERASQLAPDMIRILLTGQADMTAATRAINYGRIFRFLTKPCEPDALRRAVDDALEQHRLVLAEKELLQKTVYGCVKVLTDLLSLVNPVAFTRACRVNRLTQHVAKDLNLADVWQLDLAVMLAHLGYVGMAPELLERHYAGAPLEPTELQLMTSAPRTAQGLLAGIPRLDTVLEMIERLGNPVPAVASVDRQQRDGRMLWAAHIILAAERADQLSQKQPLAKVVADTLHKEGFDPRVVDSFLRAEFESAQNRVQVKMFAVKLEVGMFLVEDARSNAGVLVARGGTEITATVITLLRRMAERNNLVEPLLVSVKAAPGEKA